MILRLELPFIDPAVPKGVVRAWRVEAGQSVGFGAVLCEVSCFDRLKLKGQSLAAHKLIRAGAHGGEGVEYRLKKGAVEIVYEIVASEPARLLSVYAGTGTEVKTGDLLALLATGAEEPPPAPPPTGTSALRAVARPMEHH